MTRPPQKGSESVTPQESRGAATERREPALEGLGDWRRTRTCGELTRRSASQQATLMGWVHRMRDHGGVLFVDLRDRFGITQIVFRPEVSGGELLERASRLGNEWVIAVRGVVGQRPSESLNPALATGEVE